MDFQAGQLLRNTDCGRFGVIKKLYGCDIAVVTRADEAGNPTPDSYRFYGMVQHIDIWVTRLDSGKWVPVACVQKLSQAVQLPLFT